MKPAAWYEPLRGPLLALGVLGLLCGRAPAQSTFELAAERVRQGDYTGALAQARQAPDPLQAAQAELHVFHYAGDLDQALAAGRRGLAEDPREPWLLENTAYVALSLGLGGPAVAWLETLEEVSPGRAPAWMMEEAQGLQETRLAEQVASTRARTTVIVGLLVLCAALFVGALRSGRGDGVDDLTGTAS